MESAANRYCSRGQACTQYEVLDMPAKLNRYNKDDVCEQCRQAEREEHVSSANQVEKNQPYESGLAVAVKAHIRDWVVQLYKQRGPFWEAIRDIRARWHVTPDTHLPESWPYTNLYPDAAPEGSWDPESPDYSEESYKAWNTFLEDWLGDLNSVVERFVPEKLRIKTMSPRWQDVVAACVLYQPSDTELVAFANYAMPSAEVILSPSPSAGGLEKFIEERECPRAMVLPPIKQIRDPQEDRASEARYWNDILVTVWELYIQPQGVDFKQMFLTALESENLRKKNDEWNNNKLQSGGPRYYIEVDAFTTEDDVRRAFRMLSAAQESRPKSGRPRRDKLTRVEAAILHDSHNWTYEQLAERYDWNGETLASKYVKDGRAILEED
jgi:hypothetical protein